MISFKFFILSKKAIYEVLLYQMFPVCLCRRITPLHILSNRSPAIKFKPCKLEFIIVDSYWSYLMGTFRTRKNMYIISQSEVCRTPKTSMKSNYSVDRLKQNIQIVSSRYLWNRNIKYRDSDRFFSLFMDSGILFEPMICPLTQRTFSRYWYFILAPTIFAHPQNLIFRDPNFRASN